jgi:hypothetical protein
MSNGTIWTQFVTTNISKKIAKTAKFTIIKKISRSWR